MPKDIIETPIVKLNKRQNFIQFLKFTAFSISAGAIQFASAALLFEVLHLPEWLSYLIALVLSVVYNFTVNRHFTFKSANNIPIAMLKIAGYYCVFAPLSTLWTDSLNAVGWNFYIVLIGTMLINFVSEFTFVRFVVFRKSINTNKLGQKENAKNAQEIINYPFK